MSTILVIEDEETLAGAMQAACEAEGYICHVASSAKAGRVLFNGQRPDVVVLDIGLPDGSGLDLLPEFDGTPVLMITAHGSLENAVTARQRGAAEYIVKPFELAVFQSTLRGLMPSKEKKEPSLVGAPALQDTLMIGASQAMQAVFAQVAHACVSDVPVFITGPTGTGKTLCARIIHQNSPRREGDFISLHCTTLPDQLLESELFGHEKGAFTGAGDSKSGHVERAAGGTLFLDEIAEVSSSTQAKLLRFVEEKIFTRVGGREDVHVDTRLIAATHRNLNAAVEDGTFREDLFYRLRVLVIRMPGLSERIEDLPALAGFFLAQAAGDRAFELAPESIQRLQAHDWPGNVRELRNAMEHAVAVCPGGIISPRHLPEELNRNGEGRAPVNAKLMDTAIKQYVSMGLTMNWNWQQFHDGLEDDLLKELLERFKGKSTLLARELDMNRSTLLKKRKRFEESDEADE